jgi:DnaJ-domain-containing protein 1
MNSDLWIHLTIFIAFFVITGILVSRKMKKKEDKIFKDEYQEIQAEILEADDLIRQAKLEKEEARKERKKAEELMRIAIEEWDHIRKKMHASHNEMRNPYEVLGVHRNDSFDTIKEVYRKLITIYHPVKHGAVDDLSQEPKKELSAQIKAAYDWVLKHHPKYEK